MPCGALKKFAVYYAMPIRLCLLFLKVMNLIIFLKNKNKQKKEWKQQEKQNVKQTSVLTCQPIAIFGQSQTQTINSLVRFVNAKGEGEEDCDLATDMRNKQLFIARSVLKTHFHLFAIHNFPLDTQLQATQRINLFLLIQTNAYSFSICRSELRVTQQQYQNLSGNTLFEKKPAPILRSIFKDSMARTTSYNTQTELYLKFAQTSSFFGSAFPKSDWS